MKILALMGYIVAAITMVGGVASVIALFRSSHSWRHIATHSTYLVIIAILSFAFYYLQHESYERALLESASQRLLDKGERLGPDEFINASLAFIEKHKTHFPDSYRRSLDICDLNQVFLSEYKFEDLTERLHHSYVKRDVASMLNGIVVGMATSSSRPNN